MRTFSLKAPAPKGRGWIWVEQQITLANNFQLSSNMAEIFCFLFNKSGVLTMIMTKITIILREYHLWLMTCNYITRLTRYEKFHLFFIISSATNDHVCAISKKKNKVFRYNTQEICKKSITLLHVTNISTIKFIKFKFALPDTSVN